MVPRLKVLETAMPSESPVERFFRKLRARFTGRHKGATTDKSGPELEPNDIIVSAGDVNDPTYYELRNITTANEGNDLPLKVIRVDSSGDDRTVDIVVRPVRQGGRVLIGFLPALDVEHPVVAKTIKPDPNAEGLNLPRGSTITTVNGTRVSSFLDMATQLLDIGKGTVTIEYATPDGKAGSAGFDLTDVHKQINLPAAFDATIPFEPLKRTYKANGPVQAVEMGFAKTMRFILTTYATLRSLVEGRVSTENMMGPVGILHASYYIVSREPLIQYVYFIGILSSVIAVFNFLPLPPLDGGLALFLLIEKIKGSPVSAKIQSVLGGAGWILIGALLIFVTFNDIIRWVGGFF
jgi:regulator of sigma E protease